jgi:hypothetical protein
VAAVMMIALWWTAAGILTVTAIIRISMFEYWQWRKRQLSRGFQSGHSDPRG